MTGATPRRGFFTWLRAQPGCRTAAIGFFLTVALGLGVPHAYALWHQTATVSMDVATGAPNELQLSCQENDRAAVVSWDANGAKSYSYTISSTTGATTSGTGQKSIVIDGASSAELLGIPLSLGETYTIEVKAHYGGTWVSSDALDVRYSSLLGLFPSVKCL